MLKWYESRKIPCMHSGNRRTLKLQTSPMTSPRMKPAESKFKIIMEKPVNRRKLFYTNLKRSHSIIFNFLCQTVFGRVTCSTLRMSLTSGLAMLHTPPFRAILVFVATSNSLLFNLKPFRLLEAYIRWYSYLKQEIFVDFLCIVDWNLQWTGNI